MLKELLELEEPPNQVIMIDLDEAVMVGCSKHMRSVAGHYMDKDKRKGQNYEVICGDAIDYMEKAKVSFMMDNMKYMATYGHCFTYFLEISHIFSHRSVVKRLTLFSET